MGILEGGCGSKLGDAGVSGGTSRCPGQGVWSKTCAARFEPDCIVIRIAGEQGL